MIFICRLNIWVCDIERVCMFDSMWCDAQPIPISQNVHKLTGANARVTIKLTQHTHTFTKPFLWIKRNDEQAAKDMLDVDKESKWNAVCIINCDFDKKPRRKRKTNCRVLIYDRHEWRRKSATNYQGIIFMLASFGPMLHTHTHISQNDGSKRTLRSIYLICL